MQTSMLTSGQSPLFASTGAHPVYAARLPVPKFQGTSEKPDYSQTTLETLHRLVSQNNNLKVKIDAMGEIAKRRKGTAETYQILQTEVKRPYQAPGACMRMQLGARKVLEHKNYHMFAQQAALWSIGLLWQAQHKSTPTENLPCLNIIEEILMNRNESFDLKAAAVQALGLLNRPGDHRIGRMLWYAANSSNQILKELVNQTLAGKGPQPSGQV